MPTQSRGRGPRVILVLCLALSTPIVIQASAAAADLPLIEAVRTGNVEQVRALLGDGADPNTPATDGSTALQWAAHREDVRAAELLVRAGARPEVANRYGATALLEAATTGSRDAALKALVAHPLVPDAHVAADVLQALVDRGLVAPAASQETP